MVDKMDKVENVLDLFSYLFENYFDYNSEASSNQTSASEAQILFKESLIQAYERRKDGEACNQIFALCATLKISLGIYRLY
jgi:hypothetical protein